MPATSGTSENSFCSSRRASSGADDTIKRFNKNGGATKLTRGSMAAQNQTDFKQRLKSAGSATLREPIDPTLFDDLPHFNALFDTFVNADSSFVDAQQFWELLCRIGSSKTGAPFIRTRSYHRGDISIQRDTYLQNIYWLLEGGVEIRREIAGKNRVVYVCNQPGDCFGELTVLLGAARSADITAAGKGVTRVLELDWGITTLPQLPELNSLFHIIISRTLAEKLKQIYVEPEKVAKRAITHIQKAKAEEEKVRQENIDIKLLLKREGINPARISPPKSEEVMGYAIDSLKELLILMERESP